MKTPNIQRRKQKMKKKNKLVIEIPFELIKIKETEEEIILTLPIFEKCLFVIEG
jgi:hypothetical protein